MKLKNIGIATLTILFVGLGYSFGCCQVATALPSAEKEVIDSSTVKSLLWEISGKELESPSYLYGTIHMIPKEDFFLTPATEEAFAKAQQVTFEIDMAEMNDFTVLFKLLGQIMMKEGKTIKDLVSAEEYEFIKTHFEKIGLPFFMFEKIKPMILATFANAEMGEGMQSGAIVSYEMEFMKMAEQKEAMSTAGLETIEFQMSMFDSIAYEDQAQMLIESIKGESTDTTDSQFDEMVELYKEQDVEGMISYMAGEDSFESYEDVLLTLRNKNWIPLMEGMMQKHCTFFAVGAGHLGGKNGVISLLKQQGYTLTPKP